MSKKRPDILIILSVLLGSILVAGAVVYASLQNAATAVPKAPLTPYSEQVLIPDSMQRCSGDEQCIVVDTTCSFCCKYLAINANHEQLFNQMFDQSCQPYKGPMCECFDLSSYPKCVDGVCRLVKFDEDPGAINKPLPASTMESRQPAQYQFPPMQSLPPDALPPPPPPQGMPKEEPSQPPSFSSEDELPPGFFEP